MAISTYKTFLMHKEDSSSAWKKLVDIKSFPALGGDPEMIDVTTLSDAIQINIPGIQSVDSSSYECNYDKADFEKLKALEGTEQDFAVWFGGTGSGSTLTPDGSNGKFKFKGIPTVYVAEGSVNNPVNMTLSIAVTTVIEVDND